MPLLTNLAEVQFLTTMTSGQAVSNTFHISKGAGGSVPTLADLTNLAADIVTYFQTTYQATIATTDTFQSVTVRQVTTDPATDPAAQAQQTVAHVGTHTLSGSAAPESACAVLRIKTPLASRRSRGHLFLPPGKVAADMAGDVWSAGSTYITNCNNLAAKFATGCLPTPTWTGSTLSAWTLCVYSKTAALAAQPYVTLANAAVVDPKVHWLRSRERGAS